MARRYSPSKGTLADKFAYYGWTVTESNCWEWNGSRFKKGYGKLHYGKGNKLVHRLSYGLYKGPVAETDYVCHTCDNPPCMNPEHLYIGDDMDNVHDMFVRGRAYRSKLNAAQVLQIRELKISTGMSNKSIGELYGVSHTCIGDVVNLVTWKFV